LTRMRGLFSKPLRPSARHLFEIFRRLEWGNLLEILSWRSSPTVKSSVSKTEKCLTAAVRHPALPLAPTDRSRASSLRPDCAAKSSIEWVFRESSG
jgi:hypothetical protein